MRYLNHAEEFGHRFGPQHEAGWWVIGGLLWLLFVVAMVALAVVLVLRLLGRLNARGAATGSPAPALGAPAAAGPDPAITELRRRYARGEVSREDFLQAARDLGAPVADGESPPSST